MATTINACTPTRIATTIILSSSALYPVVAKAQKKQVCFNTAVTQMKTDAIFRVLVCWIAAAAVLTGIYTHSFKKTAATYIFGMFAICGVLLPDWEFFDRDVAHWLTSVRVDHDPPPESQGKSSSPARFRLKPVRMAVYTTVYGFAFYKWWNFIIST